MPLSQPFLPIGGFVWTPDELGLGRLVAVDGQRAQVQYMHSLSNFEVRVLETKLLRRAGLTEQTRVFVKNSGRLYIGQVIHAHPGDDGLIVYQIQFPNEQAAPVPERFVKVRCLAPVGDPVDALTAIGFDTQFIHDRRTQVLEHVVKGRAGTRSFAGLLSSSVDLYPHQLAVVRRVTEDAMQRYILADEVGLGKTVEAGAVIRQHLLEHPDAAVLVLAPEHLVGQWQTELGARFHLDDFGPNVSVVRHGSLSTNTATPSMLVVDEVHHLVGRQASSQYENLRHLALSSARLLLLSATPVLEDQAATLRLFHLVDPVAYPLADTEAFTERIARRREIGRLLLILASDASAFVMSRAVEVGRRTLPDDPDALAMLGDLDAAVHAHDDPAILLHRARVREYLADTYRLSKRLLRSRRRDLAAKGMFGRAGHVSIEALGDPFAGLAEAMEDWRSACAAHLLSLGADVGDSPRDVEAALAAYRTLMDALPLGPLERGTVIEAQVARSAEAPLFPEEGELLKRLGARSGRYLLDIDARCSLVHAALERLAIENKPGKLVVFTSSRWLATELAERLPSVIGYGASFLLTSSLTRVELQALLEGFQRLNRPAVLLTDRTGEDGLNLQFADGVLHLDLPVSLMRVEQRIGRLDRIGRRARSIRQLVVLPSDDSMSPWLLWYRILADGFKVFSESVADLQLVAPDLERQVLTRLLLVGAINESDLQSVGVGITTERDRLDEQYALDSDEMADADESQDLIDVAEVDRDDEQLATAMSDWWEEALGLVRDLRGAGTFLLQWDKTTRLPETPWRQRISACLGRPLTYSRTAALTDLRTRLIRTGSPLVDAIPGLLRYDDRGSAFATWRHVPQFAVTGEEWVIFKFVFVVEADVGVLRRLRSDAIDPALQRRVDRLAPPWIETLYLDTDHRQITREDLLALASRPYEASDRNLGSRPDALFSRIPQSQFDERCRDAAQAAGRMLRESLPYLGRRQAALDRAERQVATARTKIDRMRAGSRRLGEVVVQLDVDANTLESELELARALEPRADAMGIIILSGEVIA